MKYLCSLLIIIAVCIPAFANDSDDVTGRVTGNQPVDVGVIFTSKTFSISDDLADVVTGIIGNAVSAASSIEFVDRIEIENAGSDLGFTRAKLYDTANAAKAGQAANVPFVILSGIDFDFKKAAKTGAAKGLGRILGTSRKANFNPTFNIRVIDTEERKIILEDKAEIDAFTDDMKQKMTSKAFTAGFELTAKDIDTSAIYTFITPIVPDIQNVIARRADKSTDKPKDLPKIPVTEAEHEEKQPENIIQPSAVRDSTAGNVKAMIVNQPAYHSMNFYVFKPADIPEEYYITYDGYYVYTDHKGIWNYASLESGGISKTGYVVGSVIPSVVGLKPYKGRIPITQSIQAQALTPKGGNNTVSASSVSSDTEGAAVNPEWKNNDKFMAVSKWNGTVDRIGVLDRPSVPVAWKGDSPSVVYAWTGEGWIQMQARGKDIPAVNTIRRELYDLAVLVNQSSAGQWTETDIHILEQCAHEWGYDWQSIIVTRKDY